jgi:hypothetical protein
VENFWNVIPWKWRQHIPPQQSAEGSDATLPLFTEPGDLNVQKLETETDI